MRLIRYGCSSRERGRERGKEREIVKFHHTLKIECITVNEVECYCARLHCNSPQLLILTAVKVTQLHVHVHTSCDMIVTFQGT